MSLFSFFVAMVRAVAIAATLAWAGAARAQTVLHHVHGLSYAPDGALVVPSHVGLAVYRGGRWSRAPGPAHDYMGFSMTGNAIYSSGHPAPGSALRNPFGLIKSTDGGKTWRNLGLTGEADFHLMAAGWKSNVVYVVSEQPNSRMREPGIYWTRNDGKSWTRALAQGIESQVLALAAHPADASMVAAGTLRGGLMLSRDAGKTFRPVGSQETVTAALFLNDGKSLLYAAPGARALIRRAVSGDSQERLALPALGKDFVLYIAQHPGNPRELAIATRNRNVFVSKDAGASWRQIAKEGEPP